MKLTIEHLDTENNGSIYAQRRTAEGIGECDFYHTMELPKYGLVSGEWDLRSGIKQYLGRVEFSGKRVLDIGTASGFLAFWIESQGAAAEVIALDVSENDSYDIVPCGGKVSREESAKVAEHVRKMNNSFWFAHQSLDSKVKMVYATVYDIPESIGTVNISILGSILIHLRDPFLALQKMANLTAETIVVTDTFSNYKFPLALLSTIKPMAIFMPNASKLSPLRQWWSLPPRTVVEFLRVLGFRNTNVSYHFQRYHGRRKLMYTVVGRRQ